MQKSRTFLNLLAPSQLGVVAYFVIALVAFLGQAYYLRQHLSNIYKNFGFEGRITSDINHWLVKIVGADHLNIIVLAFFWALIGVGVYLVAHSIVENLSEFAEDLSVRKYIWPQNGKRNSPLLELFEKTLFRLAMVILGVIYVLLVMKYLIERSLPNVYNLSTLSFRSVIVAILWIIVYMLALHVLIVILRLIFLRRRLFSQPQPK